MNFKSFRKRLQKQLSKVFGYSQKELFSTQTSLDGHFKLAEEMVRERVQDMRQGFEEYIKERYPEFKDVEFKWEELL